MRISWFTLYIFSPHTCLLSLGFQEFTRQCWAQFWDWFVLLMSSRRMGSRDSDSVGRRRCCVSTDWHCLGDYLGCILSNLLWGRPLQHQPVAEHHRRLWNSLEGGVCLHWRSNNICCPELHFTGVSWAVTQESPGWAPRELLLWKSRMPCALQVLSLHPAISHVNTELVCIILLQISGR